MISRLSQVALLTSFMAEEFILNEVNGRLTIPEGRNVYMQLGSAQERIYESGVHFYFWNWREWDLNGAFVQTVSKMMRVLPKEEFRFIRVGSSFEDGQDIGKLAETDMQNGLHVKAHSPVMPLRFKERRLYNHGHGRKGRLEILLAVKHSTTRMLNNPPDWGVVSDKAALSALMQSCDASHREDGYLLMYWHNLPHHTDQLQYEPMLSELVDTLDSQNYKLLLIDHDTGATWECGALQTGIDGFHVRKPQSITF